MANLPFQSDILVTLPTATRPKSTIALSATGDIQLVTGRDKLVAQMTRAIINDDIFNAGVLNDRSKHGLALQALVTNVFRKFRDRQLKYVNAGDINLDGYSIWRKAAGSDEDYVRISNRAINWKFVDNSVENGTQYLYGISRMYQGVFETRFMETFTVTPTGTTDNQDWVTGTYFSAFQGNQQVTVFVDYNRQFKASEILNKITNISATQDPTEPRQWNIVVTIEDLMGKPVTISATPPLSFTGA